MSMITKFNALPDETLEDLQINNLYILQKKTSFRFGMDAVLLSNFVSAKKNQSVLDLGSGTGIIPVLLSAKTEAGKITGIEIQPEIASMASRSVEGNGLCSKIEIIEGDLKNAVSIFGASVFDIIVSNPPYTKTGGGLVNPDDSKAIARHEIHCTLLDVLETGSALLKPNGEFFLVHRPDRLTDIIEGMRRVRLEPKILRLVCPRVGDKPSLILVKGLKYGNSGLRILPDLFIYDSDNKYTTEAMIQYSQSVDI